MARTHASVLGLAALFWAGGSVACLLFAAIDLFIKTQGMPELGWVPYLQWIILGGGALLGMVQGVFVARVARRDAQRILSLDAPRWHHFFPKVGLVAIFIVVMCCAIAENLLSHFFIAVVTFGGALTCVGVSLAIGSLRIVLCARAARTSVTSSLQPATDSLLANAAPSLATSTPMWPEVRAQPADINAESSDHRVAQDATPVD